MVKKLVSTALCMIMAASVLGGCGKKDAGTIKIGAVLPLTGDVATFGQSTKNGIQLAVDETNKKGGILGKKIETVYEDDQNTPSSSANAGQKLINNDNVIALIGSVTSKCSIALGPIANESKIPMITSDSTNPKVTQAGEYVFRACFIDPFQGTVLAKYATEDLKAKKRQPFMTLAMTTARAWLNFSRTVLQRQEAKWLLLLHTTQGIRISMHSLPRLKISILM